MKSILLVMCFILLPPRVNAQSLSLDSLQSRLTGTVGPDRLSLLLNLSKRSRPVDIQKALVFAEEGRALASGLRSTQKEAEFLVELAWIHDVLGNHTRAVEYGKQALELSSIVGDRPAVASAYNVLGVIYNYVGQYSHALENHLRALAIREDLKDNAELSRSYNNLGIVYHNLGQFTTAIAYYQKAIVLKRQRGDSASLARSLHNLGFTYYKCGDHKRAMALHTEAYDISKRSGNTEGETYAQFNLGVVMAAQHNHSAARRHLTDALSRYRKAGQLYGAVQTLNALGESYRETQEFAKAETCLDEAILLGTRINASDQLQAAYESMSRLQEQTGNAQEAFRAYRQYTSIKDSLFSRNENGRIVELTVQYEKEKKERAIERLEQEGTIRNLILEKKQYQINVLIGGIVALGVMIGLLWSRNRGIQKTTRVIEQQKIQVEHLYQELKAKTDEIKVLGGLIPICSHCKNIRDDEGFWSQLESYISKHSEATFTHGLCPDCLIHYFPEDIVLQPRLQRGKNPASATAPDQSSTPSQQV